MKGRTDMTPTDKDPEVSPHMDDDITQAKNDLRDDMLSMFGGACKIASGSATHQASSKFIDDLFGVINGVLRLRHDITKRDILDLVEPSFKACDEPADDYENYRATPACWQREITRKALARVGHEFADKGDIRKTYSYNLLMESLIRISRGQPL